MRRPHKRCRNRLALAQGLAWLLVPMVANAAPSRVAARTSANVPCTADQIAFATRLRGLEELVAEAGSGQCMLDEGLVLRFAARDGLRSAIARWIFETSAAHGGVEWRLTRNRAGDVVVTLQCRGEVLAFVSAHVPSISRLPRI